MGQLDLSGFSSQETRVKYACAKQAIVISEESPAELYEDLDFFVDLLNSENNIFQWTAINVIGNLSQVDSEKRIDPLVPCLMRFLESGKLITINHAIRSLGVIATQKADFRDAILDALLRIEELDFETAECRNIAVGKVILALDLLKQHVRDDKRVLAFVEKQTENPRNATGKKAKALQKKLLAG